ncbi:uncharacterized protein LOC100679966 [Nasonia vitripennis]|uniref:Uncharacterized protein n=1 Tax=Nasonia vitripennis TaxID=7425 RepID=A0A7M7LNY4_NASVI|nr:uncharacterized protein LOC100679966 [Nasonia vitripennis]
MILSAHKCGCPVHDLPQISQTSFFNPSFTSLKTCESETSVLAECDENESTSGCDTESEIEEPKPTLVSEIASKGLPYKEIEAVFNNSRIVMRIQKERPKEEFDPPCDCIDLSRTKSQSDNKIPCKNDYVFQKASEACRTVSVYPHPDPKNTDAHSSKSEKLDKRDDAKKGSSVKEQSKLPTVNPEENPNIFVLKIRRKCETGDKKHSLDLEFKTPRPWRKRN